MTSSPARRPCSEMTPTNLQLPKMPQPSSLAMTSYKEANNLSRPSTPNFPILLTPLL